MATQQKGIRQPLGTMQGVDRTISMVHQNMALEETRNLKLIYAKRKLEVDIPTKWTVNKVKCMLCTHFDILNFDKFQFQSNKMLIPGKTLVANLPDDELIVTRADCPNAFEKYYKKTIKQVVKKYNINTQSTILPIVNKDFSYAMTYNVPKGRRKNLQPVLQDRNRRGQDEEGVIVINIFRVIGLAFLANIIFSFASYWQIGVLVVIACIYYLIDEYVKENERRRVRAQREAQKRQEQQNKRKEEEKKRDQINKQKKEKGQNVQEPNEVKNEIPQFSPQNLRYQPNQNQFEDAQNIRKDSEEDQEGNEYNQKSYKEQNQKQTGEPQMMKKPERKIFKAKLKLWMAFVTEVFYCYILSIFPNWTVQTHLHANEKMMDQVMDEVKELDPEASEQIKKWEFKKQEPLIQAEQKQDHEEPIVEEFRNE